MGYGPAARPDTHCSSAIILPWESEYGILLICASRKQVAAPGYLQELSPPLSIQSSYLPDHMVQGDPIQHPIALAEKRSVLSKTSLEDALPLFNRTGALL